MAKNSIGDKMQLLQFLPYGYISKYATTIAGKDNQEACRIRLGDNLEAQITLCDKHRQRTLYKARSLVKKGYVQDTKRSCGTPAKRRSFRRITKAGVALLLENPDGILIENSDSIDSLLSESVTNEHATPLAYACNLIKQTKISTEKYSPNQLYNIWRISHIIAMFQSNGYLTWLDKRPYDTGFAFDSIVDEASFITYVQKHGYNLPAITHYALKRWYTQHPGFYRITQTAADDSEDAMNEWLQTPAFYSKKELPSSNSQEEDPDECSAPGSKQTMRAIYVGLATGISTNYACYHAKKGVFAWSPEQAKQEKDALERDLAEMKRQNPRIPCNSNVSNALYFCTSIHQFLALFETTMQKHIKYKQLTLPISKPYAGVHVIPVNDSGGFLLWLLMEFAPEEVERMINESLVSHDSDFEYREGYDTTFALWYQGKFVFCGYTMNLQKINRAVERYLDGFDFYIGCFPDQVAWYRQLFPEAKFI